MIKHKTSINWMQSLADSLIRRGHHGLFLVRGVDVREVGDG